MKKKYTKKQITEAIAHWTNQLAESNRIERVVNTTIKDPEGKTNPAIEIFSSSEKFRIINTKFGTTISVFRGNSKKATIVIGWSADGKRGRYSDIANGFRLEFSDLKSVPTFVQLPHSKTTEEDYENISGKSISNLNGNSIAKMIEHNYFDKIYDAKDDKDADEANNAKIQNSLAMIKDFYKVENELGI